MKYKFLLYAGLGIGLLVPVGIDVGSGAMSWGKAVAIGAAVLAGLWCSWPSYRSLWVRQAAVTASLLVVVNAAFSPFFAPDGEMQNLEPNFRSRFQITESKLAGLPKGVQVYSTNEHGHRTNRPIDYAQKAPGALRIATFGGSTTEGVMLDDKKTWPTLVGSLLEKNLDRPVEVINTAVSGTRAEQHLVAFKRSEAYRPDVAVFMLGINDWNRDILWANDKTLVVIDTLQGWSFYQSVLWRGAKTVSQLAAQWASPPAPGNGIKQMGDWFGPITENSAQRPTIRYRPDGVDPSYAEAVQEIIAECKRREIPCLFIDQPTAYGPQFTAERRLWMNPPFARYSVKTEDLHAIATMYNDWLATTIGQASPSFCAIADKLPPTTDVFFDDCHFNEHGSLLVAKLVSKCLIDASLTKSAHAQ